MEKERKSLINLMKKKCLVLYNKIYKLNPLLIDIFLLECFTTMYINYFNEKDVLKIFDMIIFFGFRSHFII